MIVAAILTMTALLPGRPPIEAAVDAVAVVQTRTGSGAAVVLGDGEAVTAAHVVGGTDRVTVRVAGREMPATVTRRDAAWDLAVLSFDTAGLHSLSLASELPRVSTQVFVIGAPGGDVSVTSGIVSRVVTEGGMNVIQTDAAVNPGNSGGALVDADGALLGVVVSRRADAEGVGFAVAAPTVAAFLDGERSNAAPVRVAERGEDDGPSTALLAVGGAGAAAAAAVAAVTRRRARRRQQRRLDPEIVLHQPMTEREDVGQP